MWEGNEKCAYFGYLSNVVQLYKTENVNTTFALKQAKTAKFFEIRTRNPKLGAKISDYVTNNKNTQACRTLQFCL